MSAENVIEVNKLDVIHFGNSTYFVNVVFECDSCLYANVNAFGQETLLHTDVLEERGILTIMRKEQCCSQSWSGCCSHYVTLSTDRES